jgi:D-amino-acid dehydrogenase
MQKIFLDKAEKASIVEKEMIKELCPIIDTDKIYGAFLLHKNAHLDPSKLLINLKIYLKQQGVDFIENTEIIDIETSNNKITSLISKEYKYQAKEYILATGINTTIAKKINTNLIQIPTKGYSITLNIDDKLKPKLPIMLTDKFAIITPRKDDIRITSNLEIGSTNPIVEKKRVDTLLSNIKEITNDFKILKIEPWCGFRALTPDDKPLLGRDIKYKNLVYSMGLGWLGMTFGGSIGKMVSSLIIENKENIQSQDIVDFSGLIK